MVIPLVSDAFKSIAKFLVEVPRINPSAFPAIVPSFKNSPVKSTSLVLASSLKPKILASGAAIPNFAPRASPKLSEASTIKASIKICFILTSNSAINVSIKSNSSLVALTIM